MDTNEFTESGTIVVTVCLGVTVGFQERVSLDNLVLQATLLLNLFTLFAGVGGDKSEVGNDLLRVLSLTGTRFTTRNKQIQKTQ